MGRRRKSNNYRRPDHFTDKAKQEGYMARSVYKLEEIDKRARIFKPNQRVVDLGCFPGSWSQYALKRIGRRGTLVGVDFKKPKVSGAVWIDRSVFDVTGEELFEALGGKADVVISDMAPNTSGNRDSDHYAQIEVARQALRVCEEVLKSGGSMVCKIFEGPDAEDFQREANDLFKKVKRMRPDAVRKVSREWFLVATGKK